MPVSQLGRHPRLVIPGKQTTGFIGSENMMTDEACKCNIILIIITIYLSANDNIVYNTCPVVLFR